MQPKNEADQGHSTKKLVVLPSTIQRQHKFISGISLDPHEAVKIAREVRSHAARVSANNGVENTICDTKKKRRRRTKPLTWPVEFHHSSSSSSSQERNVAKEPLRAFPTSSSVVPVVESPVARLAFIPLILDNYLENFAVAISEIDGPNPGPTCLIRKDWFPMVMHFPTLFQVIILFSASHYASTHKVMSMAPDILFLKHLAISGLQTAITSAYKSRVGDEVIAAAVKMASYEAIYGSETAYHTHMSGVKDMVGVRGGFGTLGLDGLLQRMIQFVDANSSFLLNCRLHFDETSLPPQDSPFLPNPSQFIGVE